MQKQLTDDDERDFRTYESPYSLRNNSPLDFLGELEEDIKYELVHALLSQDVDMILEVKDAMPDIYEAWTSRKGEVDNYNEDRHI